MGVGEPLTCSCREFRSRALEVAPTHLQIVFLSTRDGNPSHVRKGLTKQFDHRDVRPRVVNNRVRYASSLVVEPGGSFGLREGEHLGG